MLISPPHPPHPPLPMLSSPQSAHFKSLLPLIFICHLMPFALSLRIEHMEVPPMIANGTDTWLRCSFETEDLEALESVKWYRNNVEFYRYMVGEDSPGEAPLKKAFPQQGVRVDMKRSNATHVFLGQADLNTEGTYGCEVSVEDPPFKSVKAEADLRLYVIPSQKLTLIGVKSEYSVGDLVQISCMSGPSKPPAVLAWFVNGNRIYQSEQNLNLSWSVVEKGPGPEGLTTSFINISFFITNDKNLFSGALTLQCSSVISQVFGVTFEELVVEEHGLYTKLNEYSDGYPVVKLNAQSPLIPPQIHGISSRYRISDKLEINCTSAHSYPPPFLEWFVNNRPVRPSQLVSFSRPTLNSQKARKFTSTVYDSFALFDRDKERDLVSTLGLRFIVRKEHYQTVDAAMRLKCVSIHAKVIHKESEGLVLFSDGRTSSLLLTTDRCPALEDGIGIQDTFQVTFRSTGDSMGAAGFGEEFATVKV